LSDRVATPLSPSTAGTLVHLTALTALLDGAVMPWPGHWLAAGYGLLVALLALGAIPRLSSFASLAWLGAAMAAWLGLCLAIVPRDPDFSPAGPVYAGLFLLAFAIPFEWGRAQWESRRLLDMFQHYVAKPVLDELLRNRTLRDPLAPRHLEVTTLIADMEGYATLVEGISLEEAVALTREFLDCLTLPVLAHGGTLDKYTGDGLMAFWGAPLPVADHADRALDAARDIKHGVARFNGRRQARGLPPVRVRVGVESGLAVVGDLGTPFRSAYTAVGDSVNVASRLQELARELPHDIVIGSNAAQLATRHQLLALGNPLLRGRHQAKGIFTLAQFATQNSAMTAPLF
jgi:adenylate cyclase